MTTVEGEELPCLKRVRFLQEISSSSEIWRCTVKKLTTGKIWQFAAGQFGWAMLSGIISNWLVYFYQPDKTAISQGQTVFIPQGLVVFGIFTIIGGITAFGRILMLLQIQ